MITVAIPCTCEDGEHDVEFDRDGSGGIQAGDKMPCGYTVHDSDVEIAAERFARRGEGDEL